MGDISTNYKSTAIPTMTGAAVSEGKHHTPHPAITAAQTTLWLMEAPIAIHAVIHPTGIATLNAVLSTSPTGISHATIPQDQS